MIVYNVTVKLDEEIREAWLDWIRNGHMQEVLNTGCFDEAHLYELKEPEEESADTFIVQYVTDRMERYETYTRDYAARLRGDGQKKFEGKFVAFRTVMEKLSVFLLIICANPYLY